jgi:hypothetical protein
LGRIAGDKIEDVANLPGAPQIDPKFNLSQLRRDGPALEPLPSICLAAGQHFR